jgi:ubiquinone/menaquinone biosynthesis C-methylase UbiE
MSAKVDTNKLRVLFMDIRDQIRDIARDRYNTDNYAMVKFCEGAAEAMEIVEKKLSYLDSLNDLTESVYEKLKQEKRI